MLGFRLLDDAVDAFSFRRMEDPAVAQPESDVRRRVLVAVGDEVARPEVAVRHGCAGLLLLVGVARDETAKAAIGDVDEAGAVDATFRHSAPEIGRPEIAPGLLHRLAGAPAELVFPHPARVVVHRADQRPAVAPILDADGLAA